MTPASPDTDLSLGQAAARCRVSRRTIYNWLTKGIRVRGQVVYLRAVRMGGWWRTSDKDLAEFTDTLTGASPPPAPPPSPRARRRSHEAAVQLLKDEGVL